MFYSSLTNPDDHDDRTLRLRRARPMIALAGVAFAIGAILGANHSSSSAHTLAASFVAAWADRQYSTMYSDISAASRRTTSASEFTDSYLHAAATATATAMRVAGKPRDVPGGLVAVPVRVHTRLFGTLSLPFTLKIANGPEGSRVAWSRSLAFPGLAPGELLARHTRLPPRAALLTRDGGVLADGSASEAGQRSSPLGTVADAVLGSVGPIPPSRRTGLETEGVPAEAIVGTSGLERALDDRLRGTPGGELLARNAAGAHPPASGQSTGPGPAEQGRVLASARPRPAPAIRTSVSAAVQQAAVTALGGQLGGIVAMQPSGQILAVAGIGIDDLQPPGSTFKMITLTGVLQAGLANPRTVFPYKTFSTLDGVKLSNANGESCGGTLELAFATSCNSVFAPLGAKLGAQRLVATAERFGFNHDPGVPGAVESTLPPAAQIKGELDVGSTAIGQGQALASALQMATVAATVADDGRRPAPTFVAGASPGPGVPATTATIAHTVRRLMIGVVRSGTGTSAAIPGVTVAGKTGTAELKTASCSSSGSESSGEPSSSEASEGCKGAASEPSNTDAWFASFAPALHPRIVVGVLLVKDGAGGTTAAPVARQVLEAGLHVGH